MLEFLFNILHRWASQLDEYTRNWVNKLWDDILSDFLKDNIDIIKILSKNFLYKLKYSFFIYKKTIFS